MRQIPFTTHPHVNASVKDHLKAVAQPSSRYLSRNHTPHWPCHRPLAPKIYTSECSCVPRFVDSAPALTIFTMRYVLFALSAWVPYAIFYFASINGLDALSRKSIESGKLPSIDAPLRTVYTGVEAIDHVFTLLTTFFYPMLDGHNPGLLLHSFGFSGTFGETWTLIVLESWRKGNAGTIAA